MKATTIVISFGILLGVTVGTTNAQYSDCPLEDPEKDILYPHETNCNQFYKCSNGQKVLQECPEGLLYNAALKVCDWPENVDCSQNAGGNSSNSNGNGNQNNGGNENSGSQGNNSGGECPSENTGVDVLFPHETNCNQFYKCNDGQKVLQVCPSGLLYNAALKLCDWPENVDCSQNTGGNSSNSNGNGNQNNGGNENSGSQGNNSSGECPSENTGVDVLFPHETKCNQFYKCNEGQKVLQVCPPGLLYNAALKVCDWPENVDCSQNTGDNSSNSNGNGNQNNGGNENSGSQGNNSGGECPSENTGVDVLFPHETNCNQFYKCNEGQKVLQVCPSGLLYNAALKVCDWPENVDCSQNSGDNNNNTNGNNNQSNGGNNNENSVNENNTTVTVTCPTENNGITLFLPHETNCNLFYLCDNGNKILEQCPGGLSFNTATNLCDWPENVNCANNIVQDDVSTDENGSTEKCQTDDPLLIVLSPHESNCSLFYNCDNGRKVVLECPAGLHFNPQLMICDWPKNANCQTATKRSFYKTQVLSSSRCPIEDGEIDILFPHETNCSQFYKCNNGNEVIQDCPAGLHFDPKDGYCNWPQLVNCGNANNILRDTSDCPEIDGELSIFYPHESNCSQYYRCSHGRKILHSCPDGLHFNSNINVCDWPYHVKCNSTL